MGLTLRGPVEQEANTSCRSNLLMKHARNGVKFGFAAALLGLSFVSLCGTAFADNDAMLSSKIVGRWGEGRSTLVFSANHKVVYSNIKAPGRDKDGIWSIESGWLNISFWPSDRNQVSFVNDVAYANGQKIVTPSMRLTDTEGGHRDWSREK